MKRVGSSTRFAQPNAVVDASDPLASGQEAQVEHRGVTSSCDDDVIDQWHSDEFGGFGDHARHRDVLGRRRGITARVVVDEHDRARRVCEGSPQNVACRNRAAMETALRDATRSAGSVPSVESQHPELFVLETCDSGGHVTEDFGGAGQARPRCGANSVDTVSELDPGAEPERFREPDAGVRCEPAWAETRQPSETSAFREERLGEHRNRLAGATGSQHDRQELSVSQRAHADGERSLSGPDRLPVHLHPDARSTGRSIDDDRNSRADRVDASGARRRTGGGRHLDVTKALAPSPSRAKILERRITICRDGLVLHGYRRPTAS